MQQPRENEATSLATASFGDGDNVSTLHCDGPGLRLDRGGCCIPGFSDLHQSSHHQQLHILCSRVLQPVQQNCNQAEDPRASVKVNRLHPEKVCRR